jgi:predicted ATPase
MNAATRRAEHAAAATGFGLRRVDISCFRSAHELSFSPGPLCALVGEADVGKSNVLTAIWMLLDPHAPAPVAEDVSMDREAPIRLAATLAEGDEIVLDAAPPGPVRRAGTPVPVLFLSGARRAGGLLEGPAGAHGVAARTAKLLVGTLDARAARRSTAGPAIALVEAVETCCRAGVRGLVLLIEEPELYLRPQAQRYLYRLLREFAAGGNQVLYSTHAPAFLNVGRLEELALVERRPKRGTRIVQPRPLPADESFRALSEFDAERSELFLARAALLVEGRTEKLVFPFIFGALGHDADREAISIVECGGKPNIPLFARVCEAVRIPYLVVHDRDAPRGKQPIPSERAVNAAVVAVAGRERVVELAPDFEAVAGLRGHAHKPEQAWRSFAGIAAEQVPTALADVVTRTLALLRD